MPLASPGSAPCQPHARTNEEPQTWDSSQTTIWPSDRIVVIDDYGIAQEPENQEGMSDV
jgi:hypothetical protein